MNMKRIVLFFIIFSMIFVIPCFADRVNMYTINDCDIVVAFVEGHNGTIESYADDLYDYGGFKPDGVYLVVDVNSRDAHIGTSGKCIELFDNHAIYSIESDIYKYLANNEWDNAEAQFVTSCRPYLYSGIRALIYKVLASMGIGTLLGGAPLLKYKKQLKSVQKKTKADNYLTSGSVALTNRNDIFLHSSVTRTPIPRSNNVSPGGHSTHTHVGSSGNSHGGHSFKF